ncbi:MAG: O-antigen ligase family protein, partial [bacterium]
MILLALIILVACFAFLAWRNLVFSVAILLFFLPLYQWRFSVFDIPFTVLEMLLCVCILVWIAGRRKNGGRPLAELPWRWALLLFAISATIAVFVSPDHVSALGYLKAYFFEPMLFFIFLWDTIRSERQIRILLYALGAAVLVYSLVAFLQYLSILPSLQPWISESPKRVVSVYDFPNALALFVTPLLGLFASFALLPSSTRRAGAVWFPWGILLIGCAGIIFVMSRGAFLAVVALAVFFGVVSRYRRWILLALAAAFTFILLFHGTRTMLLGVVQGTDVSTDVRYVLWQGTANLLRARPIAGAGLGGFPIVYDHYRLIKHVELLQYPHNIFLNAWVEIGLAGLLLFCWLLIDAFRRGIALLRTATLSPFGRQLVVGALAALI